MNDDAKQLDPQSYDEQLCSELAAVFESAGLPAPDSFPISTGDVVRLLDKLDYDCPGDDLLQWVAAGTIVVPIIGGHRSWGPRQVQAAILQCEARRRWRLSARHYHKMTSCEVAIAEAKLAGCKTPIRDLDGFDIESLLLLLESSDDRSVRHVLRLSLQQKLKEDNPND